MKLNAVNYPAHDNNHFTQTSTKLNPTYSFDRRPIDQKLNWLYHSRLILILRLHWHWHVYDQCLRIQLCFSGFNFIIKSNTMYAHERWSSMDKCLGEFQPKKIKRNSYSIQTHWKQYCLIHQSVIPLVEWAQRIVNTFNKAIKLNFNTQLFISHPRPFLTYLVLQKFAGCNVALTHQSRKLWPKVSRLYQTFAHTEREKTTNEKGKSSSQSK